MTTSDAVPARRSFITASRALRDVGPRPGTDGLGPSLLARRRTLLTWALGAIWLLDAALQYQPYMFTTAFPNQAIRPTGQGSPHWVASPVNWAATLMADHIVVWNALFATIQLAIAFGLFWRRTTRVALAASIVWAAAIWWLGEGLGGVLAGPVSPLMGLPGAVIVYALIAVFVWPRAAHDGSADGLSVAEASPAAAPGSRVVWLVFWAAFAYESLRPADRAATALRNMVTGMADGEPGWIRSIDSFGGRVLGDHGTPISIALAVVFALIAASVFASPALRRAAIVTAVVVALAIWVFGENFGQIATGDATDPNSGPLLILLALCYWPGAGVSAP